MQNIFFTHFDIFFTHIFHSTHKNLQFNSRARQAVNKETPPHWRLLLKTCCSMFRRSRSTNFTCAASQAVCILNICKTFHGIQVPLNFLFKFTEINLVLVNIKPFEFHLIRLCSFCNICMSNDVEFFEKPYIYSQIWIFICKINLKFWFGGCFEEFNKSLKIFFRKKASKCAELHITFES